MRWNEKGHSRRKPARIANKHWNHHCNSCEWEFQTKKAISDTARCPNCNKISLISNKIV